MQGDTVTTTCLLCESKNLTLVIDLGYHPLADTFLKKEDLSLPEETFPLQVLLCSDCGHAMLSYIVPPEKRYQAHDYSYTSGNSKVAVNHFADMAKEGSEKLSLSKDDLVVDIGGNDGTLLKAFESVSGSQVLNIEPSHNIAAIAKENNIETLENFFDEGVANEIAKRGGAKLITMNNAFNHIGYLREFMGFIKTALTDDGMFMAEVPYLKTMVELTSFDTIYLEHTSFFLVKPLAQFLKKFVMIIAHLEVNDYMGGSIRVYMQKGGEESPLVKEYVTKEEEAGLYKKATYDAFMNRVRHFKFSLCNQLFAIKNSGGVIAGIGAATKGNTLLNYCKIDNSLLEFVTDASPLKVGKFTPGSHIPIKGDDALNQGITHALILPWNIGEFLKSKLGHLPVEFLVPQMDIS